MVLKFNERTVVILTIWKFLNNWYTVNWLFDLHYNWLTFVQRNWGNISASLPESLICSPVPCNQSQPVAAICFSSAFVDSFIAMTSSLLASIMKENTRRVVSYLPHTSRIRFIDISLCSVQVATFCRQFQQFGGVVGVPAPSETHLCFTNTLIGQIMTQRKWCARVLCRRSSWAYTLQKVIVCRVTRLWEWSFIHKKSHCQSESERVVVRSAYRCPCAWVSVWGERGRGWCSAAVAVEKWAPCEEATAARQDVNVLKKDIRWLTDEMEASPDKWNMLKNGLLRVLMPKMLSHERTLLSVHMCSNWWTISSLPQQHSPFHFFLDCYFSALYICIQHS